MTAATFKNGVERVLRAVGFEKNRKSFRRDHAGVVTVIDFDKAPGRWHLNVGFWIRALGTDVPDRVPGCHLYYRLDGLFREHRNVLLDAGALESPIQAEAYEQALQLLGGPLSDSLKELGTPDALRAALATGRLEVGLIRKEAREYLAGV